MRGFRFTGWENEEIREVLSGDLGVMKFNKNRRVTNLQKARIRA